MLELILILISTAFVSLVSLVGVLVLAFKEAFLQKILLVLVSLSAGVLIGGAFFHLMPETIEQVGSDHSSLVKVFFFVVIGFVIFFIFEQFILWHHCHQTDHRHGAKSLPYVILASDTVHNFIDGATIASAFVVDIQVGLVTTLAIVFHEVPQEFGDFGVLIYGGFNKYKAVFFNFLTALAAILGGMFIFFFSSVRGASVYLLPFAAGSFIYIATTDLVPEIKHPSSNRNTLANLFYLVLGIVLMFYLRH